MRILRSTRWATERRPSSTPAPTRPDIVISDVIMPGLNGYELCQRFKTDPDLQSVPFLFLKGTFESFDEEKARSCGADGFIVKPFESQEMIAKVKDLIGKAAAAPAAALPTPIPRSPARGSSGVPAFPPPAPRPDVRSRPRCSSGRRQRRRFRRSSPVRRRRLPAIPAMSARPGAADPSVADSSCSRRASRRRPRRCNQRLRFTSPRHQQPPPVRFSNRRPRRPRPHRQPCRLPSTTLASILARRRTIVLVRSPPNHRFPREPHLRWNLRGRAMRTSGAR